MVNIPENEVTQADLAEWYRLKDQLATIRNSEMLLRQKIFKGLFPTPKEGTNSHTLPDGYVVKATHTISRDIDVGAVEAYRQRLTEQGVAVDKLLNWKPSLVTKEYRTLTEEQRNMFDACLIIKPGSPTIEIVKPKTKGSKA